MIRHNGADVRVDPKGTEMSAAVDVLIPAYNAEKTVETSIRSIQDQTIADIRIIVVNDGSTDRTGELLHGIAAADPRVTVIDTPNQGIVAALNLALGHATAPMIARHDADDIAFPDRFSRQLAYLHANPDCIAVGGEAHVILNDGRRIGRTDFAGAVRPDPTTYPAVEPYLMHPFLMIRAAALHAAGGYRYVLHAEDADLYWRLLSQGRLHNLHDFLGEYRSHPGSVSSVSVHRGRVGSAYAELAALSFRRREAGRPDIEFPNDAISRMEGLRSIEDIVAYLSTYLSSDEREHFRLATAAKLLNNASFRPYLLEQQDCCFIAEATPKLLDRVDRQGRARLISWQSVVALKLLRQKRYQEVKALDAPIKAYLRIIPMLSWWALKKLGRSLSRK